MFNRIKKGKNYLMFINGKWVNSSNKEVLIVDNPAKRSTFAFVPKATKEDAEKAIQSANNAKQKIADLTPKQRAAISEKATHLMHKHSADFLKTLVAETGKPISQAKHEVHASIERLKIASHEALHLHGRTIIEDNKMGFVTRKPLGVILGISPFNYTLFSPIAKVAPAIASGNSFILKPASNTPVSALLIARLFEEAGLPPGVLNVVTGYSSEIGPTLIQSPLIQMISLTGNTKTGEDIAANCGMKKLQFELGGKCPALVLEDADIDLAVKECVKGALKYAGQRCDALSRILVADKIADKFIKKVLAETKKWNVGSPTNKKTMVGPLINETALARVSSLVDDAVKKGAKVLYGNKIHPPYFYPTVLDRIKQKMRIYHEEIFGPIIAIIRFKSEKEALKIANSTIYGLDASIFTQDLNKALNLGQRIECGCVHINAAPSHGIGTFPFGGTKKSGLGREGIFQTIKEMTELHSVIVHKQNPNL